MPDEEIANDVNRPGRDPDEEGKVETLIKVGWAVVGMFFSLGIFAILLERCGIVVIPEHPTKHDYFRIYAFVVALLNVGVWVWFPVDDLHVLRRWIQTSRKVFPAGTGELYSILFTMCLLIFFMIAALQSSIWFCLMGGILYAWDALGFRVIRRHLAETVHDARTVVATAGEATRTVLDAALDVIEWHWALPGASRPTPRFYRPLIMSLLFFALTITAIIGSEFKIEVLSDVTFFFGATTALLGEAWITSWRMVRDRRLRTLAEELRAIKYLAKVAPANPVRRADS